LIQSSDKHAAELKRAALEDLDALSDSLQVRCPVSVVIGGMESESGFRELTRRIGPEAAKSHRFGKGADPWTPPTPDYLEAVTRHATGAFEDWAYHLFSAGDGLSHYGNPKLYSLLCRIRTDLQDRLVNVVCDAYGREVSSRNGREAMLFSGCYFAATGPTDDRQAFVKSTFTKLLESEAQVSWMSKAVQEDDRYGTWAFVANCVMLVEVLVIIILLADRWRWFGFRLPF
ncbi:MAG: hypothetical protein KF861_01850, partial [Planctomycetaceae bacterium]|nr:hypothetical protein [Planctomycetaceae bacterium]